MNNLKWLLPRLPLPMLALAASYGVYQFALLFVPWWVALIQAAAFETTYLGLAMIESETAEQRRRATAISVGAVVVSVLYNSLAGFLHRNGLGDLPMWGEIVLATLHGAPLAIVAYLVADLLLHKSEPRQNATLPTTESPQPVALPIAPPSPAPLPLPQPDSRPVAPLTVTSGSVLPDWLMDAARDMAAPQEEPDTSKLHLSKRVPAILKNRPDISNAELYALLPGENHSSIRKYVGDWRKEQLAKEQLAAASHNGNGRH